MDRRGIYDMLEQDYKIYRTLYAYHTPKQILKTAAIVCNPWWRWVSFLELKANGRPINPDINNIPTIEPKPKVATYKKPSHGELICVSTSSINAPEPARPCIIPINIGFHPRRDNVCECCDCLAGSCRVSSS